LDEQMSPSDGLVPVGHAPIPGVEESQQPIPQVREAYWYGTRLTHHGWIIRRVGATNQRGFFVAETPRGRSVTVHGGRRDSAALDLDGQFADAITVLDRLGVRDGHDHIRDLALLLSAHAVPRRPAGLRWRTWHIPGVAPAAQPVAVVRAAYWFAATLTDDYGWELTEFGSPTAGGGFIADIPGETIAIYPATMPDDGTTASALARLLAGMNPAEIRTLASLIDWHTAARAVRSPGR
jgi:hypothetical protein